MKDMWHSEPFKAKWSLLAKAYSLIRDNQGKENAPLAKFFDINGPLLDIIKPDQYLKALNCELARDETAKIVVHYRDVPIDDRQFITNTSVNDLLWNSYSQGYFTDNVSDILLPDNEASMTMATSVQPARQLANSHRVEDYMAQQTINRNAGNPDSEDTESSTGVADSGTQPTINLTGMDMKAISRLAFAEDNQQGALINNI